MKRNRKIVSNRSKDVIIYFLLIVIVILITIIVKGNIRNSKEAENESMTTSMENSISEEEISSNNDIADSTTTQEELTEPIAEKTSSDGQEDNTVDIVVFGDSIWDDYRGNNGVAEQVASITGYNIYNCAIGGSSATITDSSTDVSNQWDNRSLSTMVYIADGTFSAESQLEGHAALDVIKNVDFSKVDYFILSYGLNDYFMHAEVHTDDYYNMDTYEGVLRHSIMKLQAKYPDTKIILISPTYCKVLTKDNVQSDSDHCDYGKGTLLTYVDSARKVANEMNACYLDAYNDFGMNASNADVNLRDGVHFTEQGMTTYAQNVANFLLELEGM